MHWHCPRCRVPLGEVLGLVASCPKCSRAYSCITEEQRERSLAAIAKAKRKPIPHGNPLQNVYKEPEKVHSEDMSTTNEIPTQEFFAAWIVPSDDNIESFVYSGRTGFFGSAKSCLKSAEGRFPADWSVELIRTTVEWEKVEEVVEM